LAAWAKRIVANFLHIVGQDPQEGSSAAAAEPSMSVSAWYQAIDGLWPVGCVNTGAGMWRPGPTGEQRGSSSSSSTAKHECDSLRVFGGFVV
jgi:hypothetical protein